MATRGEPRRTFERALALDSNNARARSGWVASYQDEQIRAKERFERAITLSPADPLAFNMRMGLALALTDSLGEAISIAREVVIQAPGRNLAVSNDDRRVF